jgi:uncharacterized membrane protein
MDWTLSAMDVLSLLGMVALGAMVYGSLDQRVEAIEVDVRSQETVIAQVPPLVQRVASAENMATQSRTDIRESLAEIKAELREIRKELRDPERDR